LEGEGDIMRRSFLIIAALALVGCGPSTRAQPSGGAVATAPQVSPQAANFMRELSRAHPGDTIRLEPGVYSGVVIKDFSGPVTITSKDPAHRAVFTDLKVANSHRITFAGLEFLSGLGGVGPLPPKGVMPFEVAGSSEIHFDKVVVHGPPQGTLADTQSGLIIRSSTNVSVTNSDFFHLHNGFMDWQDDHVTISGNSFHDLYDHGVRGGSSNVLVDSNHCYSMHPDKTDTDHPDCIIMWTRTNPDPFHDITITNNRYERGTGLPVQFIFVKDIPAYQPFLNVTIANNVAVGAAWNGIMVQNAKNVIVTRNIITPGCDMLSWIRIENVDGIVLKDNAAGRYIYKEDTALKDQNSRLAGCVSPKKLFEMAPTALVPAQ
jgi:hypothetical protein